MEQWQKLPPRSARRKEFDSIAKTADKLIEKLTALHSNYDDVSLAESFRLHLLYAADRDHENTGESDNFLFGDYFEANLASYTGYRDDETLEAAVNGVKRIACWSHLAALSRAEDVQADIKARHGSNTALDVLIYGLSYIYETRTLRAPGVSRPSAGGAPGGPWLRFLQACLNPLGVEASANALDARWRRVKKIRESPSHRRLYFY